MLDFDFYFGCFFILSRGLGRNIKYIYIHGIKKHFFAKLKLNLKDFDMAVIFDASLHCKSGKEFLLDSNIDSFKFCSI